MTNTRPLAVIVLVAVGGVVAGAVEWWLTASGRPAMLPPVTLAIAMALIGVIVVILAVPVRRAVKSDAKRIVDPFYATRVLVLGKASAIAGALFTGFAIGALVFVLTRSVVSSNAVLTTVMAAVGAAVLLAGGLVAEWFCRVEPPEDDDSDAIEVPPVASH